METLSLEVEKRPCVIIHVEQCKGCKRCVAACPKGVLALSETLNSHGYQTATVANPDACIGCGTCFYNCPEPGGITVYRKMKSTKTRQEEN